MHKLRRYIQTLKKIRRSVIDKLLATKIINKYRFVKSTILQATLQMSLSAAFSICRLAKGG
jgi:hypothetical protein